MFTLLSGLWRYLFRYDEYFVLILGLDNAGKTTLLEQAKTKFSRKNNSSAAAANLSKITTTVGLNIGKVKTASVVLNFWDLGGQDELQLLWDKYYAEAHAIIYVVDSVDRERLEASRISFEKMIKNEILKEAPLLLVVNKQDIEACMPVAEVKAAFAQSRQYIGHRDVKIIGASALQGSGVIDSINWVAEKVKENQFKRPPIDKDDVT